MLAELSKILEVPVTPQTILAETNWDSMSVVMAVAAVDDICGTPVDGMKLADCATVADVLRLAGLGEEQTIGPGDVGSLSGVLRP